MQGWRRVTAAVVALAVALAMALAFLLGARTGPVVGGGVIAQPWRPALGRPDVPPAPVHEGLGATDSRAYNVSLVAGSLHCARPPAGTTDAAVLQGFADCVVDGHRAAFARAGITLEPVRVRVFRDRTETGCGVTDVHASYCPADRTISVEERGATSGPYAALKIGPALVLTHEIGHHLQLAAGISADHGRLLAGAPDEAARAEVTRRAELQATCFGAVLLAAMTPAPESDDLAEIDSHARRTGDDVTGADTHGSIAAVLRWTEAGLAFATPSFGRCVTWAAPSSEVR